MGKRPGETGRLWLVCSICLQCFQPVPTDASSCSAELRDAALHASHFFSRSSGDLGRYLGEPQDLQKTGDIDVLFHRVMTGYYLANGEIFLPYMAPLPLTFASGIVTESVLIAECMVLILRTRF